MKFHVPLDDLLHGRTNLRVLRTLFRWPGKEFTGRELAALAGADPSNAIEALRLLEAYGLVERRGAGRAHLWKLRNRHFMARRLPLLFRIEEDAASELRRRIIRRLRPVSCVDKVVLFGSPARGSERAGSDVDLLVVVRRSMDKRRVADPLERLNWELRETFGNPLSPIVYSRSELAAKRDLPILQDLEREGLVLVDRNR